MHLRLVLATAALVAACSDSPGVAPDLPEDTAYPLDVVARATTVDDGATLPVSLVNRGTDRLSYNLCTDQLEVLDDGTWRAGPASLRLCAAIAYALPAGETREESYSVDLGVPPGTYRLRVAMGREAGALVVRRSEAFTVR